MVAPPMIGLGRSETHFYLATAVATRRQKRLALVIAAVSLVLFFAIVPFVRVHLPKAPGFIPSYEAALFLIDLITAVLLFDQFARLRSLAVLFLASAYLFDALVIIPHALSFPGAFATTGLLGAREQTTAWLYVFWHGGFPLFVIAYARLRRQEIGEWPADASGTGRAIALSVLAVAALVVAITLLTTVGHDWLPVVIHAGDYSMLVSKGISPVVWLLTLAAMLSLWRREQRVVDLWLMLVMWIWLFDIALAAVLGSSRFDLGFYAGRVFGLIASSFLLITFLAEMGRIHAGAVRAAMSAEERLAQFARLRSRPEPERKRGETTDAFVHRQNIAHYRWLLQSGSLDEAQRELIEGLLASEEGTTSPSEPRTLH